MASSLSGCVRAVELCPFGWQDPDDLVTNGEVMFRRETMEMDQRGMLNLLGPGVVFAANGQAWAIGPRDNAACAYKASVVWPDGSIIKISLMSLQGHFGRIPD